MTGKDNKGPSLIREYAIDAASCGQRLDSFLAVELEEEGVSRSRVKELLGDGHVLVNGDRTKPSYRLRLADLVTISIPPVKPVDLVPEKVDFDVLYEDGDVLVISKPPGIVVHPACGHEKGTLVHGLLFHCDDLSGISGEERPGIVHRLDMDTSGVMIVAKNDHAHHALVAQFQGRQVEKTYRALVHGIPSGGEGRIELAIGRHPANRRKMAVRERSGKPAVTNWHVLEVFSNDISYIELDIETGRTHQIRVHMAALGHPVLGDRLYGGKNVRRDEELGVARQCLHSYRLTFIQPSTGERLSATAPLHPDMKGVLEMLRNEHPLRG